MSQHAKAETLYAIEVRSEAIVANSWPQGSLSTLNTNQDTNTKPNVTPLFSTRLSTVLVLTQEQRSRTLRRSDRRSRTHSSGGIGRTVRRTECQNGRVDAAAPRRTGSNGSWPPSRRRTRERVHLHPPPSSHEGAGVRLARGGGRYITDDYLLIFELFETWIIFGAWKTRLIFSQLVLTDPSNSTRTRPRSAWSTQPRTAASRSTSTRA